MIDGIVVKGVVVKGVVERPLVERPVIEGVVVKRPVVEGVVVEGAVDKGGGRIRAEVVVVKLLPEGVGLFKTINYTIWGQPALQLDHR